jgi:hypothetical protein
MSDPSLSSRRCAAGGYIVGPNHRVPEDERYFQTPGAAYVVGCNQLRCTLCGTRVRQQVGLADGPDAPQHARAVYDEADLARSPYLVADPNARLYSCGCSIMVVTGGQAAEVPNHVCTCGGHPAVDGDPSAVLPRIAQQAANDFSFHAGNAQLTESVRAIAVTMNDGSSVLGTPAQISLGGGWPALKLWIADPSVEGSPVEPTNVDFQRVAGLCVQLTDKSLKAF